MLSRSNVEVNPKREERLMGMPPGNWHGVYCGYSTTKGSPVSNHEVTALCKQADTLKLSKSLIMAEKRQVSWQTIDTLVRVDGLGSFLWMFLCVTPALSLSRELWDQASRPLPGSSQCTFNSATSRRIIYRRPLVRLLAMSAPQVRSTSLCTQSF